MNTEHTATAQNKTDALCGREIMLRFEEGADETITVKPLRVSEYPRAFRVFEDEAALLGVAINKPKKTVENLKPDSYEQLYTAVKEVNECGFFVYAARQMKASTNNLSNIPPELLRTALDRFISQTQSRVSLTARG